jgi:hypothetical protein
MMTCARGGGALGPVGVLAKALVSAIVSTVWGGRADGACGEVHLWRGRRDVPGQQALSVPRLRQNDEAETDSKLLNLGE